MSIRIREVCPRGCLQHGSIRSALATISTSGCGSQAAINATQQVFEAGSGTPFDSTLKASRPAELSHARTWASTQWRQVSTSGCATVCYFQSHWNYSGIAQFGMFCGPVVRHFLRQVKRSRGQDLAPHTDEKFFGREGDRLPTSHSRRLPRRAKDCTAAPRPLTGRGFFGGEGIAPPAPLLTLSRTGFCSGKNREWPFKLGSSMTRTT